MSTVIQTVTRTVTAASTSSSSTSRAAPQGGVFEGSNPSEYDSKNPIILFIIQAGIIIVFCRLLHWPLSKIRQPRVIAEVIGGIILGPSVMGRIPGFTDAIFPTAAQANLTLVANLGLVLFLFLVGLEVDLRYLSSNWKIAFSVGAVGMALPFGLGCAIAYGLYHQFRDDSGLVHISFGIYMLFIGVAMAITAFPVLCRILTELKLLSTSVGVIVLSAGVGNDVMGWILLALCVALVNAGTGLTALWILLTCIGFIFFMVYAVRPAFIWVLKKTGSLHNGPTQSVMALTVLLVLSSAFFTGIIGIHPIFGAFIVGLICPHEAGFAIKVTEKIEDLVTVLLLPLYFALSGLSTNLGLLNNAITWAYVIGVICVAFFAKVTGGTLAARFNGLVWRESFAIGVLMSCKGLVELIVLNIGLQAKILSTRTFTIFVVMALVTTFLTTPLTIALYPEWYQKKLEAWKRGEIDWDGNPLDSDSLSGPCKDTVKPQKTFVRKVLVYLRLDSLSSIMTFVTLLGAEDEDAHLSKKQIYHPTKSEDADLGKSIRNPDNVKVHGVHLVELTERDSTVMQVSEMEDLSNKDPVATSFCTFGRLTNIAVASEVVVLPVRSYADTLVSRASDDSADLIVLPWSADGTVQEHETLFPSSPASAADKFANGPYIQFINTVTKNATTNSAIFINRGFGGGLNASLNRFITRKASIKSLRSARELATIPILDRSHHVFFPFIGGRDDRAALRFVLQLVRNPQVTATILHVELDLGIPNPKSQTWKSKSVSAVNDQEHDNTFIATFRDSLPTQLAPRVLFSNIHTTASCLLGTLLTQADKELGLNPHNAGDLIIVGRSSGIPGNANMGEFDARRALGELGYGMIKSTIKASVLVMQAAASLDIDSDVSA